MSKFDEKYVSLVEYIEDLHGRYIKKYFPTNPEHTPDIYEHDVKVFCIMSHSALEEYFEDISKDVLTESVSIYENSNKILLPLLSLLSCSNNKYLINLKTDSLDTVKNKLKDVVDKARTEYCAAVGNNHGIRISHLKSILYPVSLEIDDTPRQIDSLKKLASNRGSFAHTTKRCSIDPKEAKIIVDDCLEIALSIKEQAIKIFV